MIEYVVVGVVGVVVGAVVGKEHFVDLVNNLKEKFSKKKDPEVVVPTVVTLPNPLASVPVVVDNKPPVDNGFSPRPPQDPAP